MNEKEKEMVHQKKGAFSRFLKFWRVSEDRIVAGSILQAYCCVHLEWSLSRGIVLNLHGFGW